MIMQMRTTFGYTAARVPTGAYTVVRSAMFMWDMLNQYSQPVVNYNGWTRQSSCAAPAEYMEFTNVLACAAGSSAAGRMPMGTAAPSVFTSFLNLWGNMRPNINNVLVYDNNGRFTRTTPAPHTRTPGWYRQTNTWQWPGWINANQPWSLLPGPFVTVTPPFSVVPGITSTSDPHVGPESHVGPTPGVSDKPVPPDPPGPGPGKEEKFRFWGLVNGIKKVYRGTTEALDALECLWKALPKDVRTRPTHRLGDYADVGAQIFNPNALVVLPQEKLLDVKRHWDAIDWGHRYGPGEQNGWEKGPDGKWRPHIVAADDYEFTGAIKCLVQNHFTDEVIGRITGGAQTEASRRNIILGLFG